MNEALGMVEVVGYACAVSVADTMVKTANVEIQGLQRAKGSGWITIKVTGSVAAVEASVTAGKAQAQQKDLFAAARVIPRLASGLGPTFLPHPEPTPDPQPPVLPVPKGPTVPVAVPVPDPEPESPVEPSDSAAPISEAAAAAPESASHTAKAAADAATPAHYTCNLCKDPACPRKKGEPRAWCIHFNEIEAEHKKSDE